MVPPSPPPATQSPPSATTITQYPVTQSPTVTILDTSLPQPIPIPQPTQVSTRTRKPVEKLNLHTTKPLP